MYKLNVEHVSWHQQIFPTIVYVQLPCLLTDLVQMDLPKNLCGRKSRATVSNSNKRGLNTPNKSQKEKAGKQMKRNWHLTLRPSHAGRWQKCIYTGTLYLDGFQEAFCLSSKISFFRFSESCPEYIRQCVPLHQSLMACSWRPYIYRNIYVYIYI